MNIIINKALPEDSNALLEYLKQVGKETDNLSFGGEGLPFTIEDEAQHLAQLQISADDIMLLAKIDGKIIGNASLNRYPRRMSHRGELAITVLKEYWNKGIGSQLITKIIEFAKTNNFDIIDLQVRADNLAAIHLYKKFGFQKIGTHPAFFKIDNYIPFDYMYLSLK